MVLADEDGEGEAEDRENDGRRSKHRRPPYQVPVIPLVPERGCDGLAECGLDHVGTDLQLVCPLWLAGKVVRRVAHVVIGGKRPDSCLKPRRKRRRRLAHGAIAPDGS